MQEYLHRKLCVRVGWFYIPASVVVGYDLAIALQHSVKEAQKAAEQNQVNKKKTTGSAGSYTAPPSKDPEKMSYEEYVAYRRGT